MELPQPETQGGFPLNECLSRRRSVRDYCDEPVPLGCCSQLLWAAQGVTGIGGLRAAPSAGAIYPLRTYVIASNVEGLAQGLYHYEPDLHSLKLLSRGDKRRKLAAVCFGQECVEWSAMAVLLTADYRRIVREMGERGRFLAHVEAGHVGQNFLLQAVTLGLGAIGIARFEPDVLREMLQLPAIEEPLYLLLTGHREMV